MGQLCEYSGDPRSGSLEALAASLCPPAEAFAGQVVSVRTLVVRKSGEPEPRSLNFIPFFEAEGSLAGILGVAADSTEAAAIPAVAPSMNFTPSWRPCVSRLRRFGTQALVCRSEGMLRVAGQPQSREVRGRPF